ncbi:MAG TPA: hypothetical protein VF976_12790 [Gemmatimonadales bacterium]
MNLRRAFAPLTVAILIAAWSSPSAAAPPAPAPLAPTNGAGLLEPFTLSWSAVSDPSGIVAYNWQVSPSSSFAPVVLQNSTMGPTQDTVSGLANGTYFWRVQAVNGALVQGAWSQAWSFSVTGVGPGAPGSPTLAPTKGYSTFHPMEVMTFNWSAVPGAATYVLEAATDPNFPVLTRFLFDNITNTTYSFRVGDGNEGNYWARVYAVDAKGVFSAPSNLITFSVFFDNPLPPPPSPLSPANGVTLTLPITLKWSDVSNPQPSGYEVQIATDSGFRNIEDFIPQLNNPSRTVLSLQPGTKFWRARSVQGDSSPTTAAVTAWSSAGTFAVSSAPPTPVSVTAATNPLYSGEGTWIAVQLTAAVPVGGASIALASSNQSAVPLPASVAMPGNTAWTQFTVQTGQVTAATPVTLSATLNGSTTTLQLTVLPPSLQSVSVSPSTISGGAQAGGIVMLNGQAAAGGAVVSLSSNSMAVSPPPTVTVAPGNFSASFPLPTSTVAAPTTATITASWNGGSAQTQVTLLPQPPPVSVTLSPASTVGQGGSSFATVSISSPQSTDTTFQVTSSNPAVAPVPGSMIVPAGVTNGGFNVFTSAVSVETAVTISVSGGGVTRTATLTVTPSAAPPPPPPSPSPSPSPSPAPPPPPPPPASAATLTVTATGRNGEQVSSSPAGIAVAVGSTGSASFATGAAITLSVSNGRDAIWSGACSSGGSKTKSCTLTLNSAASVTANVQ